MTCSRKLSMRRDAADAETVLRRPIRLWARCEAEGGSYAAAAEAEAIQPTKATVATLIIDQKCIRSCFSELSIS